jgi:hypothetical protein
MPTDPKIRDAVLKKLGGISKQALSARVKVIKRRIPMGTDDAVYVIAHGIGIDLSRRLDTETLERVGRHVSNLTAATAPESRTRASAAPAVRTVRIRAHDDFDLPGLRLAHATEVKRMAERVYPLLYLFENSARDLVDKVLTARVGRDWWDSLPAAKAMHASVNKRMKDEGLDAWHGKRGDHPLHYIDVSRLPLIVGDPDAWPHFSSIFPRRNWFEGVVEDLNVSRRVVAHMNPLSEPDIRQVEAGFRRWSRQLVARKDLIDALG